MVFAAFVLPFLLAAAAPEHHDGEDALVGWCVAERPEGKGSVRYFTDVFEAYEGSEAPDAQIFKEYVQYNLLKSAKGELSSSCATVRGWSAARVALQTAKTPRAGAKDVSTGWRARFE